MKIKICWKEGKKERYTVTELPEDFDWTEKSGGGMSEVVRQLLLRAYKRSGQKPPKGLINKGEKI